MASGGQLANHSAYSLQGIVPTISRHSLAGDAGVGRVPFDGNPVNVGESSLVASSMSLTCRI